MAEIAPFKALRYDSHQLRLEDVVTQPYDKITPEMQTRYYDLSPHNLVRIIRGREGETDNASFSVYTRAAEYLNDWRAGGLLKQDPEPGFYFYSQTFTVPGTRDLAERRGFIGLGRIHDYSDNVVYRHEQTLAKPRADRLNLLRNAKAHFGQIFMLYSDPEAVIERLLETEEEPDMAVLDEYEVLHRVWRVYDRAIIETIQQHMRDKKLLIADGHHRYETALAYRNERRAMAASTTAGGVPRERSAEDGLIRSAGPGLAPYDLVMMNFINMLSTGMVILPSPRVVCS